MRVFCFVVLCVGLCDVCCGLMVFVLMFCLLLFCLVRVRSVMMWFMFCLVSF